MTFAKDDSSMKEVEALSSGNASPPNECVDEHDPLNWSTARKAAILVVVGLWIFLGTTNMIIIGPALFIVPAEFGSSQASATYLIGGPLLAYGVFSFIWVPLGNRFGVRTVFVSTAIVAACMCVWGAEASSFGALVAARTLASGFFAPPETLAPQLVGDVFHLKDRAKVMSFVAILQATGFAGGPLIGGYIVQNEGLGWRWIQWIMAILTFAAAIGLIVMLPETQYTRKTGQAPTKRQWIDDYRFWPVSGGGPPKQHSVASGFVTLFPFFCHPLIILNMTFLSLVLCVNSYLLTTQSITYLIVYNFSLGGSGLTFLAPVIGTWIALLFCGLLTDRLLWRKRSQPKPAPEKRLLLLPITGAIGIAGSILFGACTQDHCHWVAPLIGSAFVSFCFVSSISVSFAYLLDIYEVRTDSVMVVYNGVKNLAAFGISYAIVPWNTSAGYTIPFVVLAVILLVSHGFMAVCYWKGKAMREWTAARFETGKETAHGDAF